jgi:hypothetical protein
MTSPPPKHSGDGDEPPQHGGLVVFPFLLTALSLGLVFRRLGLRIPYTVLLLLSGIGLQFINEATEGGMGTLGDSLTSWSGIDPHTLLFVFIPALIYASTSSVDGHVFRYVQQCSVE